jgi:murein L,D-transpeptidase YafK
MKKINKTKLVLNLFFLSIITLIVYYIAPEKKLPAGATIDKIIVLKSKRELQAYQQGQLIKTYKISLAAQPFGKKEFEDDQKTPEGIYYIDGKNPNGDYYKNLGVSYPNEADKVRAKKLGKSAGKEIKIHGIKNNFEIAGKFHRWYDWTAGCIAVTNEEIDELYKAVKIGTPVEIRP